MGMFDSICLKCPSCGRELEFQSKTGSCMLDRYDEKNLPIYVAAGINDTIVSCVCGVNVQFQLLNDEQAKYVLEITKNDCDYPGNFQHELI